MDTEKVNESTPIISAESLPAYDVTQTVENTPYVPPKEKEEPKIIYAINPQQAIDTTKVVILVLLGIELFCVLYYFIQQTIVLANYDKLPNIFHFSRITNILVSDVVVPCFAVVFITVFIIVVVMGLRIGVLIFAWLSIIEAVIFFALFILSCVGIADFKAKALGWRSTMGVVLMATLLAFSIIVMFFTIILIIFSFKLAKLLKQTETYQPV